MIEILDWVNNHGCLFLGLYIGSIIGRIVKDWR